MSEEKNQKSGSEDGIEMTGDFTPEIKREISIDEFQPKGTLTLTLLYFVIVVLMWIFMYFVEFAGNAPSIIE